MNVTQAKEKIREITNTTTSDYSDASLVRDLNAEIAMIQVQIVRDREAMGFDDAFFSDLPIATLPVTAGLSTYKITVDDDGNEVTTIHKVAILIDGAYRDIPRKTVAEGSQEILTDTSTARVPAFYYEIGQTVYLSQVPSESTTMKVWLDRTVSQITTGDTTKVLPIPSIYHNLACYRTGYNYRLDKDMDTTGVERRIAVEQSLLSQYEANRRDDEQTLMSVHSVSGV
jgi:hypothetical protein